MLNFGRCATVGLWVVLSTGCELPLLPDSIGNQLPDVQRIISDANLTPQAKRDELAELGLSQVEINGLLQAERLGNQFGGSLASARNKVIDDLLDEMTPDEVQFYGDAAGVTLSDVQAASATNLFRTRSLSSRDDLSMWLENPANELPAGLSESDLRTVFIDTDPDDLLDQL